MNKEQKEKLMSVIRSLNAIAEHLQLVMAVLNTARVDLAEVAVAVEKKEARDG